MTLSISTELDQEVRRILAAKDSFSVLQLHPSLCSEAEVNKSHERIAKILRRPEAFRSKDAQKAKARLDGAKVNLLNKETLTKEREAFLVQCRDALALREEMEAVRERTLQLEQIARDMKHAEQADCEPQEGN